MKSNLKLIEKLKKTHLVDVPSTVVRGTPRNLTEADLRSVVGGGNTCSGGCIDDCGIV